MVRVSSQRRAGSTDSLMSSTRLVMIGCAWLSRRCRRRKNKLLQYRYVRPHRRCHIDRSIVFARWRECALPYNTWFLEPIIASTSPERYLDRFSLFCRDRLGRGRYAHNTHTRTHPFIGPFSGTTQVSRYEKGKTNLDFTEARGSEWQWHQLGHMQVCTSLQTDNHVSTPPLSFYRTDALLAAQQTASKHWRQDTHTRRRITERQDVHRARPHPHLCYTCVVAYCLNIVQWSKRWQWYIEGGLQCLIAVASVIKQGNFVISTTSGRRCSEVVNETAGCIG